MQFNDLRMKPDFKSKVISKVTKFNKKHRAFSFLGTAYAFVAIFLYHIYLLFYYNNKKLAALLCIALFFISSSSFSYPVISNDISFEKSDDVTAKALNEPVEDIVVSEIEVAESEAVLSLPEEDVLPETQQQSEIVNPDVAEIDDMVSVTEILDEEVQDSDSEEIILPEAEVKVSAVGSEEQVFKSDDWNIILVNKQHPIPEDYVFTLGTISGGMKCDERILTPLFDMLRAARADGVNLVICSPYRDINRQTMLFSNKVNSYMKNGMSYMDAYNLASQAVTVPGSSEHQIGLAVDIITDNYTLLDEGFGETAAGRWLSENSSTYGFILRYPKGKEEITSIEYEPWHFRYVGVDAAEIMAKEDICLEEFWNLYVD